MQRIENATNALVKKIKSLKISKYRKMHNLFVVEGVKITFEAMDAFMPIHILISDTFLRANNNLVKLIQDKQIECIVVKDAVFHSMCDTKTPQGILGVFNIEYRRINYNGDLIVVLEDVQDPGNVGTIIRTADAFGACGIVVTDGCADIYSPKVLRSAMGSVFHMPIEKTNHLLSWIELAKKNQYFIIAGHLQGNTKKKKKQKNAIIIGNEGNGISDDVKDECDYLWKIQMDGNAESLNASIAAGIMIHELANS